MTKDKIEEAVRELPQEVELDEFIERLIFIDKGAIKTNHIDLRHEEEHTYQRHR